MQQEYEIDVQYHYFPLHPETPQAGMTLEELFAGRNINIAQSQADMARRMSDEGLPWGNRTHTYNSRLAQELARWAESQEPACDFHLAMYQAYFVAGRNIADTDVLLDVVADCGLPVDEARHVLETRSFRTAIDQDWADCRSIGLTGVPAFVAGRQGVSGAQPYTVLAALVTQAGAVRR